MSALPEFGMGCVHWSIARKVDSFGFPVHSLDSSTARVFRVRISFPPIFLNIFSRLDKKCRFAPHAISDICFFLQRGCNTAEKREKTWRQRIISYFVSLAPCEREARRKSVILIENFYVAVKSDIRVHGSPFLERRFRKVATLEGFFPTLDVDWIFVSVIKNVASIASPIFFGKSCQSASLFCTKRKGKLELIKNDNWRHWNRAF